MRVTQAPTFEQYRAALQTGLPKAEQALKTAVEQFGPESSQAKLARAELDVFTEGLQVPREAYEAKRQAAEQFMEMVGAVPAFRLGDSSVEVAPGLTAKRALLDAGFAIGSVSGMKEGQGPIDASSLFTVMVDRPPVQRKALGVIPYTSDPRDLVIASVSVGFGKPGVLAVEANGTERLPQLRTTLERVAAQIGMKLEITIRSETPELERRFSDYD